MPNSCYFMLRIPSRAYVSTYLYAFIFPATYTNGVRNHFGPIAPHTIMLINFVVVSANNSCGWNPLQIHILIQLGSMDTENSSVKMIKGWFWYGIWINLLQKNSILFMFWRFCKMEYIVINKNMINCSLTIWFNRTNYSVFLFFGNCLWSSTIFSWFRDFRYMNL